MTNLRFFFAYLIAFSLSLPSNAQSPLNPAAFSDPSAEYGIRCWWWWLNGNTTKETITRDLEEMKAKGFSGACIFDAGGAEQRGNAQVPEGPMFGTPAWRDLYLHAIREANRLGLVMSASIQSGWNLGGPDITPEEAAKQVTSSQLQVKGPSRITVELPLPSSRDQYYRDIAVLAIPAKTFQNRPPIREFANKAAEREVGWSVPETRPLLFDIPGTPGEEDAAVVQVKDLTGKYKNGRLEWDAPAGEWTILRIGYTPTDAHVSTSSGKWQGRVIDYMSEKHFNRYWDTHVKPLLQMVGPLAGKTLRYLQTDSFEAGGMNWTDGFEKEFRKRRGYDPVPYLPVMAGKIIESREASNRFLSDLRKTLGDLIAEKHYGTFARRAAEYGIGLQPESAGPHAGPFDGLKNYGYSEIMMSEFWSPSPHRSRPVDRFFVKQAGSAAKLFDKKLVGAESFTTIGPHWNDVIWADMKPSVDHEFCAGLNLVYLHTFTSSPKEAGLPGQEYFAGTHFNPNVTWWNHSTGFIRYLTRTQYLLQQGRSVADVLYYYGDHIPVLGRLKEDDPGGALPDYDYDLINEDKLLELSVKDGLLYLPHGVSYRVLVLPDHKVLSGRVALKIETLVKAGATIIGPKPESTASLVGFPESETVLKQIADRLWGDASASSGMHRYGDGRVYWGKRAADVLREDQVPPDLRIDKEKERTVYDFIHRHSAGADLYFVSSQNKEPSAIQATFRISGRQPELWDPVSGEVKDIPRFVQKDGLTTLGMEFAPYGSAFVVFRKSIPSTKQGSDQSAYQTFTPVHTLGQPWEVSFDPRWGGPGKVTFDKLVSWTDRPEDGIRHYSGTAVYTAVFDAGGNVAGKRNLYLDLGDIKDVGVARVKLNGTDLGIAWAPPFRVALKGPLKARGNRLEIEVVNSWRNRLIGDRDKPKEARLTQTNITIQKNWELLPSGLLGPVTLLEAR